MATDKVKHPVIIYLTHMLFGSMLAIAVIGLLGGFFACIGEYRWLDWNGRPKLQNYTPANISHGMFPDGLNLKHRDCIAPLWSPEVPHSNSYPEAMAMLEIEKLPSQGQLALLSSSLKLNFSERVGGSLGCLTVDIEDSKSDSGINEDGPKGEPRCSFYRLLQGILLFSISSLFFFVLVRKADLNPLWNDALVIACLLCCGIGITFGTFLVVTSCGP